MLSSVSLFKIIVVSIFPIALTRLRMNLFLSSLLLMIVLYSSWINSLLIMILTVNGAWFKGNWNLRWIM